MANVQILKNLSIVGDVSATGTIYGAFGGTVQSPKYSTSFGNTSSTTFVINHNLNTQDVLVNVVENATKNIVYPSVTITSNNNITIDFQNAPALTAYKVTVIA